MKIIRLTITLMMAVSALFYSCNDDNNNSVDALDDTPDNPPVITEFTFNGTTYQIVRENMTWIDAAAFAVDQGGILAEINSQEEQDAIFAALNDADIDPSQTVAPDGAGASYVWLGGNDLAEEGVWILDGDNDGEGEQFWMGLSNGTPIGGLYNNWGIEPDNFREQDALCLALTNFLPLGVAGNWNDVDSNNALFFVVELN